MPMETFDAGPAISATELAEQLDAQALELAAAKQATIASVADEQKRLLSDVLQGIDGEEAGVRSTLSAKQSARMGEIQGDTAVKVAVLSDGVAGYYDGTDVVLDVDHIDAGVAKHEFQHRKDGGIDDALDDPLVQETGVQQIDERLQDFGTKRDVLEERAMDAAGEIPEPYRHTHWATVKGMEQRGQQVGVDMEAANNRFIQANDADGFQEDAVTLAVQEMARDGEGLEEVAEAAEAAGNTTVAGIVREVRERSEKLQR